MNLFSWLFIGHLAGDFLLQTRWMAENKNRNILPLLMHGIVYTLAVTGSSFMCGGLKWQYSVLIFLSHIFLDQRSFVKFWAEKVTRTTEVPWLLVVLDQTWHLLVLAVIAGLNSGV